MTPSRFDQITVESLRQRRSVKWTVPGPNGYGAFVAEMDFGAAPAVLDALQELSGAANFGYLAPPLVTDLAVACADWQRSRYGWTVDPAAVAPLPDVITAFQTVITHFSRPGSAVILPTPAYMPFRRMPPFLGREVIEVPMIQQDGRYELDLDGIAAAFRRGGHLVVLCNPANPVGRVFGAGELAALTAVVDTYGGRVFADEIHAPLVYVPHRHVPYASSSEAAAAHSVTAVSASKAWNLPGLKCAQLILTNDADRERWPEVGIWAGEATATPGVVASTAAYRDSGAWLDEVLEYLDGSRRLLADLVHAHLPAVRYRPPEGTYLAWLNFRALPLPDSAGRFVTERADVWVVDGPECGRGGEGFLRFNFATPRPILTTMIERVAEAVGTAAVTKPAAPIR